MCNITLTYFDKIRYYLVSVIIINYLCSSWLLSILLRNELRLEEHLSSAKDGGWLPGFASGIFSVVLSPFLSCWRENHGKELRYVNEGSIKFLWGLTQTCRKQTYPMLSNGVLWYHLFNGIEDVCSPMPDGLHLRLYLQLSLGIFLALRGVISTRLIGTSKFMEDRAWCQISGWYGWGQIKIVFQLKSYLNTM